MKAKLISFIILAVVSGSPLNQEYKEGDRYIYFPDGNGILHLVDLHEEPNPNIKVDANRIKFFLFTRWNPTIRQQIYLDNSQSLTDSHFDSKKLVKIVAHGWFGDVNAQVNSLVTQANLRYSDVNVIVLDWSAYSSSLTYINSARKTLDVGRVLARFIDFLVLNAVPISNVHLVGFSLGAHLIGNAGRFTTTGKVSRITGLDPAGPTFGPNNLNRLRPSDSNYTEVIHTNGDYTGNGDAMGHVDFYPNGGRLQPGCNINLACSHNRAIEYYAESIENEHFMGLECANVNDAKRERCQGPQEFPMGGAWKQKFGEGIFHFKTNSRSPFAKE